MRSGSWVVACSGVRRLVVRAKEVSVGGVSAGSRYVEARDVVVPGLELMSSLLKQLYRRV